MKKIAVFTDLSQVSNKAVEYAAFLAKHSHSAIVLVHINVSGDVADHNKAKEVLMEMCADLKQRGIEATCHIGQGAFFAKAQSELEMIMPWLVVVATHGKVGLRQHLLGSHILKLLKSLTFPTVVVQENTPVPENAIEKILFPPGAHENFMDKTRVTCDLAKLFNSMVDIYTITKGSEVRSDRFTKNSLDSKAYFESNGVNCQFLSEEATFFSAGYSRQTIEFVKQNGYDLISIMAENSNENTGISDADKENILLNPMSVPVLCV